jgi:16S rRNA (uracil1498-N3)-methyltransferase
MQKHRFYAPRTQIKDNRAFLSSKEAHHLSRVLRLDPGNDVSVFDGEGRDYRCRVLTIAKESVELDIVEVLRSERESPLQITLAQALAKGEKFDFIVQKATELGVSAITPLETDHTDVRVKDERSAKKLERWRRISLESLKQCGRSRLVEINAPATVRELVGGIRAAGCLRQPDSNSMESSGPDSQQRLAEVAVHRDQIEITMLVFSEQGGRSIPDAIGGRSGGSQILALVGPEGGWSQEELAFMIDSGCVPVTLGPRILRTETAALVAVTLIQHRLGDISRGSPD